jgi:hypothetical protein
VKSSREIRDSIEPLVKAAALLILGSGLVGLVVWANDVREDRKHTVTVNSSMPVFVGRGEDCYTRKQTTVEQPGKVLEVRRTRYWKEWPQWT